MKRDIINIRRWVIKLMSFIFFFSWWENSRNNIDNLLLICNINTFLRSDHAQFWWQKRRPADFFSYLSFHARTFMIINNTRISHSNNIHFHFHPPFGSLSKNVFVYNNKKMYINGNKFNFKLFSLDLIIIYNFFGWNYFLWL